jgi:hypothetical protein
VPPPWVEMAVMVVMVMVVAVVGLGVQVAVELVKMLRCPRSVALSQQLLATEQASLFRWRTCLRLASSDRCVALGTRAKTCNEQSID